MIWKREDNECYERWVYTGRTYKFLVAREQGTKKFTWGFWKDEPESEEFFSKCSSIKEGKRLAEKWIQGLEEEKFLTADETPYLRAIQEEFKRASKLFSKFNSYHEGKAVIEEELEELWDEIKGKQDPDRIREEAIQVGAMALRFLNDLCIKNKERP